MFIGYNYYSSTPFNVSNGAGYFTRLELQHGKFDELKCDDSTEVNYSTTKQEWGYYTVLLAKFKNSLEAGNIANNGIQIESIKIKRRRKSELSYIEIFQFAYDKNIHEYTLIDRYIENDQEYEYCIVPIAQNIEGGVSTSSIKTNYEGIWITDKNNNYQLLFDLDEGDIEYVGGDTIIETLGSKFPVINTSTLNYRKSSVHCLILSEKTINQEGSASNGIDIRQEKINRDNLVAFLKNHKPKLYRASNGEFIMISIIGNPKFTPKNDLQGLIGDVEFEWVEIDEVDNASFKRNGLSI